MGLPNLDAAIADQAWGSGNAPASHDWYEQALKLQNDLLKRRPNDPGRTKELDRIKEGLENSSPKQ